MDESWQTISINGGAVLAELPGVYLGEVEEDGTICYVPEDEPGLLAIRISALTFEKEGVETESIDLAADMIAERRAEDCEVKRAADKAWHEEQKTSEEDGTPIWLHFWTVGFRNMNIIISFCCDLAVRNDERVLKAEAMISEMIPTVRMRPEKSALTKLEANGLDEQREVVCDVLRERYGIYQAPKLRSDLAMLQNLVGDPVFSPEQKYEWQCVGVVFGDVVAAELGLEWIMQFDEYGAEPALNLAGTSITLFPRTMILKRIENGEEMDLAFVLEKLAESVKQLKRDGC
jgi:hypothetical protein